MSKIKVNEYQFKLLHLLDNVPPESRNVAFLSKKLDKHPNTIRNYLQPLVEIKLVKVGKSREGKKFYFLIDELRKRVNDCCVVPPEVL